MLFRVPPGAFKPPPKVDSAVARIDVYEPGERPVAVGREEGFFRVVRAGFGQKRKQLGNTLATGLDLSKDNIASRLIEAGIEPSRRAETMSLEEVGKSLLSFST